jgi:hypothetical protein
MLPSCFSTIIHWFAQLMSFCDKIQAPVLWDVDGVHSTIPSFNEAQCVARLKEIYYSVFSSAGSDDPKMQKYHTCFASHLPSLHKQWDAQPYLRMALNTMKASFIARFRLSSHHLACETGTWRRRNGPAGVNPTRCPWCSTAEQIVVQDEQHVFFSCPHLQSLRAQKPLLFDTVREASLWRIFNEYEVAYEDTAWFLKETKLMYTMR